MKTKHILFYSGLVVLICSLVAASGNIRMGLCLAILPLAIAFWLIIDQRPKLFGLSTVIIKDVLIATTGIGITVYSGWLMISPEIDQSNAFVQGALALVLGLIILFNVALAYYRRH